MANGIEEQVESLFSDREQWESFLELREQKDALRNAWWQGFRAKMNRHFIVDNKADGWGYISWGVWDYKWYLAESGADSLCVWCREWYGGYIFHLWVNQTLFDGVKITNLLQGTKYTPILSAFERIDSIGSNNEKLIENGNFSFGAPDDGNLNLDKLAWYAHYQPEAFLSQISRKIDRFRKDPEVSALLAEINRETKKQ
ncbi:hypothetical protein [Treponema endosymbiont of Eucomonympha sp.]|uniref:hypothetical protein n=1 Tax=Treponema endosymbiont of Eucomonympha sp. TaxID=1580831 RepID=UPI000783FE11|nr:hypothetical protein [Treponema endosymbiont of Eucomonympha sp.]